MAQLRIEEQDIELDKASKGSCLDQSIGAASEPRTESCSVNTTQNTSKHKINSFLRLAQRPCSATRA